MKNIISVLTNLGESEDLLSSEQEKHLASKMKQGDEQARSELIVRNMRLVNSIASNYLNSNVPFEDVIQAGNVGLIKAVDTFDPAKGKLSVHAYSRILAEIMMLFDNQDRVYDIPLHSARAIKKVGQREAELTQELHRKPTQNELLKDVIIKKIAKSVKKSVAELLRLKAREQIYLDSEFDAPDSEGSIANFIPDTTAAEPHVAIERKDLIEFLLKDLTDREKIIIRMYYGLDNGVPKTLKEIAPHLNVGEQRVQQLRREIERKLKHAFANDPEVLELLRN